ncbi:DUF6213 family protein [Streptacidiphilus rugosus]|uniref:DUF6213 family protein n=1 Tax=Streptacidiphilus rugosus TaxID=405783 RepID=UPI00055F5343|nr:DUF6213 family protein [Streptacidiphilus rugosus]
MTQIVIPAVWLLDGNLLVSADTLSRLVRQVAAEVADWVAEGADPATVEAFDRMLQSLADRIDVDCIALMSTTTARAAVGTLDPDED